MTKNYSLASSFCVALMLQMTMNNTPIYFHHLPLHVALTLQMKKKGYNVCHCFPFHVTLMLQKTIKVVHPCHHLPFVVGRL
jgi:hypothetical protein